MSKIHAQIKLSNVGKSQNLISRMLPSMMPVYFFIVTDLKTYKDKPDFYKGFFQGRQTQLKSDKNVIFLQYRSSWIP